MFFMIVPIANFTPFICHGFKLEYTFSNSLCTFSYEWKNELSQFSSIGEGAQVSKY